MPYLAKTSSPFINKSDTPMIIKLKNLTTNFIKPKPIHSRTLTAKFAHAKVILMTLGLSYSYLSHTYAVNTVRPNTTAQPININPAVVNNLSDELKPVVAQKTSRAYLQKFTCPTDKTTLEQDCFLYFQPFDVGGMTIQAVCNDCFLEWQKRRESLPNFGGTK